MKLWHKNLIPFLPREQLVSQWRECSAIAKSILTKGTPNHILVNYITDYDYDHFLSYTHYVREEMTKRGYKTQDKVWNNIVKLKPNFQLLPIDEVFSKTHNYRYLEQCYYNLAEKYDRGAIKQNEYNTIFYACKDYLRF